MDAELEFVPLDLKLVSVKFEGFGLALPTFNFVFWGVSLAMRSCEKMQVE